MTRTPKVTLTMRELDRLNCILDRALEEFRAYFDRNINATVNYGERCLCLCGERLSSRFVESTVSHVLAKRFVSRHPRTRIC